MCCASLKSNAKILIKVLFQIKISFRKKMPEKIVNFNQGLAQYCDAWFMENLGNNWLYMTVQCPVEWNIWFFNALSSHFDLFSTKITEYSTFFNPLRIYDLYMRQFFHCTQWSAGSVRVKLMGVQCFWDYLRIGIPGIDPETKHRNFKISKGSLEFQGISRIDCSCAPSQAVLITLSQFVSVCFLYTSWNGHGILERTWNDWMERTNSLPHTKDWCLPVQNCFGKQDMQ